MKCSGTAMLVFGCVVSMLLCPASTRAQDSAPSLPWKIVNTYPHDPEAFTQGLVYEKGFLYESTGLQGHSSLRKVELQTGKVVKSYSLPPSFFGEGLTIFGDRIIQLTWQSRVGFVYHRDSFALLRTFSYATEGWGLTHDGRRLFMSDGSDTLYLWDPDTFREESRVIVRDGGRPVRGLNELEFVEGRLYANVYPTDRIAAIDPGTGRFEGWIDLGGLVTMEDRLRRAEVANGIAYDAAGKRLFVTGKRWNKLFEIRID
jgi:glutamine cyclotransferase